MKRVTLLFAILLAAQFAFGQMRLAIPENPNPTAYQLADKFVTAIVESSKVPLDKMAESRQKMEAELASGMPTKETLVELSDAVYDSSTKTRMLLSALGMAQQILIRARERNSVSPDYANIQRTSIMVRRSIAAGNANLVDAARKVMQDAYKAVYKTEMMDDDDPAPPVFKKAHHAAALGPPMQYRAVFCLGFEISPTRSFASKTLTG